QEFAVGTEREIDLSFMGLDVTQFGPSLGVPEPYLPAHTPRDEDRARASKGQNSQSADVAAQGAKERSGDRVPEVHGLVPTAGSGDLGIPPERHARRSCLMPGEDLYGLAGGGVPNPHGAVVTGGGQHRAVGGEAEAMDRRLVPGEGADLFPALGVPEADRAVR